MDKGISRPYALEALEGLLLIRRFEEALFQLWKDGKFLGHYHLYIGQEATGVGAIQALKPADMIFTTHRNHGHLLARGTDPEPMMAEILGRETGLLGGRGGTFHLADPAHNIPHTSGLVGGCIPLAAGAAHRFKSCGEDRVSVVFFGDGAMEEGVTFEAFNIASLWRLPIIFVCENNDPTAQGRPANDRIPGAIAATHLDQIPKSLSMTTQVVDGADLAAMRAAVMAARKACIAGEGPVFIEAVTKGWPGSATQWPDLSKTGRTDLGMAWGAKPIPDSYRTWFEDEDPVLRFCREQVAAGQLDGETISAHDARITQRIAAAVERALAAALPSGARALDHVLAEVR
ncbi:MAG TPA: thiamine pyrophosphate-dependent dehydrogenase E1 component subunit alpha [Alphaproteobacteria bacterium]|jgi:pyruvate dehydrogenase E1 component alpha subunit